MRARAFKANSYIITMYSIYIMRKVSLDNYLEHSIIIFQTEINMHVNLILSNPTQAVGLNPFRHFVIVPFYTTGKRRLLPGNTVVSKQSFVALILGKLQNHPL